MKKEHKAMDIGDQLPNFILEDQDGKTVNSQDWIGAPVVVYFYPNDETSICTEQACSFRDSHQDFQSYGVQVIGISHNSVGSHAKFANKYQLPYTLLTDKNNEVRKLFGIPKGIFGIMSSRVTFVFNKEGTLVYKYRAVLEGQEHVSNALNFIKESLG